MKHLKKIITASVVGFFVFAPPGTLILIGVLIIGLLGKVWFSVAVVAGGLMLAGYIFVNREKILENSLLKKFRRKFRR